MNLPRVYTCSPSWTFLSPLTVPQGHPSAPAPSILYHASNLDWQFISYMILYMFQWHSPNSSHPLPLPQMPKTVLYNFVSFAMWPYFCFANEFICTIFVLDFTYKQYHMMFVFLTSLNMTISRSIHVPANGISFFFFYGWVTVYCYFYIVKKSNGFLKESEFRNIKMLHLVLLFTSAKAQPRTTKSKDPLMSSLTTQL